MRVKYFLFLPVMTISVYICAQDLKMKTAKLGSFDTEVFYVNKSDKSRQGPYTLTNKFGGTLISGFYSAGQKDSAWIYYQQRQIESKRYYKKGIRTGTWEFYKKGELEWAYNFDSSKATFFIPEDTLKNNEKFVAYMDDNSNWVHFPPEKHALLINSDYSLILQSNLRYPEEAQNKNQQGKVRIAVVVDQQGNQELFDVGVSSGFSSLDAEALRVMKLTHLEFIPAENKGIKVKSIVLMDVNFRLESN